MNARGRGLLDATALKVSTATPDGLRPKRHRILAQARSYKSRGPRRTSIMRLASATISSVPLFSRLTGLFGHGEVEPGEKIDALHPFPTGQTSILYPL